MTRVVLLAVICGLATGCFLQPKKKEGQRGARSLDLIDKSKIYIDRIGDGTSITLKFSTKSAAECELQIYSQEDDVEPTKEKPRDVECGDEDEDSQKAFTETINELRTDVLYEFKLTVWKAGGDQKSKQVLRVREDGSGGSSGGGDDDDDGPDRRPDGSLKELFVARMNVPLKTAEIHRFEVAEGTKLSDLRAAIKVEPGCYDGVQPHPGPFSTAAQDIRIKKLATRDFAAGTAAEHPADGNRLQVVYNALNEGLDSWQMIYELNGVDARVYARSGNRILNMDMASEQTYTFSDSDLMNAAQVLTANAGEPLRIAWTHDANLLSDAYVMFQIGRQGDANAVHCIFEASKKAGVVPAEKLAGFESGEHVVTAELVANQLIATDGWFVQTRDWRTARIAL